jgi:hypothetical protein
MTKLTKKKIKEILKAQIRQKWEALCLGSYKEDYLLALSKYLERTAGEQLSEEKNFFSSVEANELALKYGLIIPYPPNFPIFDEPLWDFQKDPPPIFRDQEIITPVSQKQVIFGYKETADGLKLLMDFSPHLKEGRYLTTTIDLHRKKKEIMAVFEDVLDVYWHYANQGKKQKRGLAPDNLCLKVYDMHINQGKPLLHVMRELYPETEGEDPNIDNETKRRYEQIRWAYRKGKRLVEQSSKPSSK